MVDIVKQYGFESLEEFSQLISSLNLTTMEKLIAFRKWQENDGTKAGLLKLKDTHE